LPAGKRSAKEGRGAVALATYKCPRTVDFTDSLPRSPAGKLYKRLLRERYWAGHGSLVV
jgi:long-chain acyl-CoA synthetase